MECEVCGHESEDAFEVVRHVGRHTFDTFECAIYALAPQCANCGVRVMGHGVIEDDHAFCCTHCAEAGPRKEAKAEKGDSGAASDNGHSDHGDAHADAGSDDDESDNDSATDDDDDDDNSDDDGAQDDDDSDEDDDSGDSDEDDEGDEGDEEGEEDEDDEDDEEKKLEKLDERISQARQNSDDLLSGPEDEADQDDADADAEPETETETGDKDKDKDG